MSVTVKRAEDWIVVRAETVEELTRQLKDLGLWEEE